MKRTSLSLAALVLLVLSVLSLAGDQLPGGNTWTGTDSGGNYNVTITSSSTNNVITVTRTPQNPPGTGTSEVCALNSAGDGYGAPDGGEYTFDDVVDGNPKAYRYTKKDAAGNVVETGLVSKSIRPFPVQHQ